MLDSVLTLCLLQNDIIAAGDRAAEIAYRLRALTALASD